MRIPPLREWPLSTRAAGAVFVLIALADVAIAARLGRVATIDAAAPLKIDMPQPIVITFANDAGLLYQAMRKSPFDLGAATSPTHEMMLPAAAPALGEPPTDDPRLIGTVVEGASGGFVMLELPDRRVQLVHVGETAGTLTLRSVSLGEATFDNAAGKRVTLKARRSDTGAIP